MSAEFCSPSIVTQAPGRQTFIDLRAPVECERGSIPGAVNLPILDDDQRRRVGTCYKHSGREAAIALGHKLITDEVFHHKAQQWLKVVEQDPATLMYCFRGGLRSQLVQRQLAQVYGCHIPIVAGGYKALRAKLMDVVAQAVEARSLLLISGNTGSAKTQLLQELRAEGRAVVNLEGAAGHRGSAFGKVGRQPCQVDFEHRLAVEFLEAPAAGDILLEDEAAAIGQVNVPLPLLSAMRQAPVFLLKCPLEERVHFILQEYVAASWRGFEREADGVGLFKRFFRAPLDRIAKGLGGDTHGRCVRALEQACQQLAATGCIAGFGQVVELLLVRYYDRLYEKSFARRDPIVVGSGSHRELRAFLAGRGP